MRSDPKVRSLPVRALGLGVALALGASGCSALGMQAPAALAPPRPAATVLEPRLNLAVTQPSNSMEREAALAANDRSDDGGKKKVTPALFWTGIVLGTVGAVGMIGGGVTGAVTEQQIQDGDAEGWTKQQRQDKVRQGEVANTITLVGALLTAVGYGMSIIVAGVDYSRCGPVIGKKRKRECATITAP